MFKFTDQNRTAPIVYAIHEEKITTVNEAVDLRNLLFLRLKSRKYCSRILSYVSEKKALL